MSGISHLLNREVSVYRLSHVEVEPGIWKDTMTLSGALRCRISTPGSAEFALAAQAGVALSFVGYFEPDADVRRNDELRGSDLAAYHAPLTVTALQPPSIAEHHLKALLSAEHQVVR